MISSVRSSLGGWVPVKDFISASTRLRAEGGRDQGEQPRNRQRHSRIVSGPRARKVNRINDAGVLAEGQVSSAVNGGSAQKRAFFQYSP